MLRFLIPWLFVALQAMAPFIHAHAGAVQLNHAGFLHVHPGAHHDEVYHAIAADEHGEEVGVAEGLPSRSVTPGALADVPLAAAAPRAEAAERPGSGLPAPPLLRLARPAHTLPHALAPPAA